MPGVTGESTFSQELLSSSPVGQNQPHKSGLRPAAVLFTSSPALILFHAVYTRYIACRLSSAALIYCKWVSFLAGSQTVSLA